MIFEKYLSAMKPEACLINTARSEVVRIVLEFAKSGVVLNAVE